MDQTNPEPLPTPENTPRRKTGLLLLALSSFALLLCLGCVGGIFTFVMGVLKSSDVYTESLAAAQKNPQVQAMLGEPIAAGYFVMGQIRLNNDTGMANLKIPISGPKGSTTLHVVAEKRNGRWHYSTMKVEGLTGPSEDISLLPLQPAHAP